MGACQTQGPSLAKCKIRQSSISAMSFDLGRGHLWKIGKSDFINIRNMRTATSSIRKASRKVTDVALGRYLITTQPSHDRGFFCVFGKNWRRHLGQFNCSADGHVGEAGGYDHFFG